MYLRKQTPYFAHLYHGIIWGRFSHFSLSLLHRGELGAWIHTGNKTSQISSPAHPQLFLLFFSPFPHPPFLILFLG